PGWRGEAPWLEPWGWPLHHGHFGQPVDPRGPERSAILHLDRSEHHTACGREPHIEHAVTRRQNPDVAKTASFGRGLLLCADWSTPDEVAVCCAQPHHLARPQEAAGAIQCRLGQQRLVKR